MGKETPADQLTPSSIDLEPGKLEHNKRAVSPGRNPGKSARVNGRPDARQRKGRQEDTWEDHCKICSSPNHPSRFCPHRPKSDADAIKQSEERTKQEALGKQDAEVEKLRVKADELDKIKADQTPFGKLNRRLRFVDQNLLALFLKRHPVDGCIIKRELVEHAQQKEGDVDNEWAERILRELDDVESLEKFETLKHLPITYSEVMDARQYFRMGTSELLRFMQAALILFLGNYGGLIFAGLIGPSDVYVVGADGNIPIGFGDNHLTPHWAVQLLLVLLATVLAVLGAWVYCGVGWGNVTIRLNHSFLLQDAPGEVSRVIRGNKKNMSFRQAHSLETSRPARVIHTVSVDKKGMEGDRIPSKRLARWFFHAIGLVEAPQTVWYSAAGCSFSAVGGRDVLRVERINTAAAVKAALKKTVPNLDGSFADLTVVDWLRTQPRFMYHQRSFDDVYNHAGLGITTNGQIQNDLTGLDTHTWYQSSVTLASVLFLKGLTTLSGQHPPVQEWGF